MKKKNIFFKFFILFFFLFNLLIPFSCNANAVKDGSVPSWITGSTNSLVNRMRSLAGKLNSEHPRGGTTCCYSISICLRGSPYGAAAEYGMDWSQHYDGDIEDCDLLIEKAEELNEWHPIGDGYEPRPGDTAITIGTWSGAITANNPRGYYQTGHAVMVTESGGCIYNGGSSGGIIEYDYSAQTVYSGMAANANMKPVAGYIETSNYSSGGGFWDNTIDWGLDMLATIADGLNKLIEDFALYATEAMNAISSIGVGIILSLIIIDFTTYLFFNGFEWQLAQLISKIMKYTFLLFIFMNWTWIVNNIFLDFAQSTASAMAIASAVDGGGNVSSNLTQPQFLLQKGVEAISPCLNFISTAKGLTNPKNWPILLFLVLITFITLAFLMFSAFYVAYVYIEFYLMAAFNALFMIFPTLRFTKFIAEGGLSGLISSTIRLFTTAWLVYLIAGLSTNATYELEFPADIGGLNDGTLYNYIFLCLHIITLVIVIVKVPDKIARIYGGSINLPN